MADNDRFAPEGMIWVCGACGKTSRDLYGDDPTNPLGWDESCMFNAVRCIEASIVRDENGRITHADPDPDWEPPKRLSHEERMKALDDLLNDPELLELARQAVERKRE